MGMKTMIAARQNPDSSKIEEKAAELDELKSQPAWIWRNVRNMRQLFRGYSSNSLGADGGSTVSNFNSTGSTESSSSNSNSGRVLSSLMFLSSSSSSNSKSNGSRSKGGEKFLKRTAAALHCPNAVFTYLSDPKVFDASFVSELRGRKLTLADFVIGPTVGVGSFGMVCLAEYSSPQFRRPVALKIVRRDVMKQKGRLFSLREEKRILSMLDHPFIVKMYTSFVDAQYVVFVMEYLHGGELFGRLWQLKTFELDVARFYAAEVVLAIDYLHSLNVVYRDLKPENILIDPFGHIRLIDFGLAKILDRVVEDNNNNNCSNYYNNGSGVTASNSCCCELNGDKNRNSGGSSSGSNHNNKNNSSSSISYNNRSGSCETGGSNVNAEIVELSASPPKAAPPVNINNSRHNNYKQCGVTFTVCGTNEYLAPESLLRKGYGLSADWWALGVLLHEMIIGHPPFRDSNPISLFCKIMGQDVVLPNHLDTNTKSILLGLLTKNPGKRLGACGKFTKDIQSHKFFKKICWKELLTLETSPPFIPPVEHYMDSSNFERYPEFSLSNSDNANFITDNNNSDAANETIHRTSDEDDLYNFDDF